jgi:hypothetical protein
MLTSNRLPPLLSRRSSRVASALTLTAALFTASCVDPVGRFDDYGKKFTDAADLSAIDGAGVVANITGTFLLAIHITDVTNARPIQLYATATVNGFGGPSPTLTLALKQLKTLPRPDQIGYDALVDRTVLMGGACPAMGCDINVNNIPISTGGEFRAAASVIIAAEANSVGTGEVVVPNLEIVGVIKSMDHFCGNIRGNASTGTNLTIAPTTFGAIRTAAAPGPGLPAPVFACMP